MTTDPIAAAIDHIRSVTNRAWCAEDFEEIPGNPVDASIATILNAVVAGQLIQAPSTCALDRVLRAEAGLIADDGADVYGTDTPIAAARALMGGPSRNSLRIARAIVKEHGVDLAEGNQRLAESGGFADRHVQECIETVDDLYDSNLAAFARMELGALLRELIELREALGPFAAIADLFDREVEGHSDTDELSLFYGDGANWLADRFTLAQFRATRAALRSTEDSHDD